MMNEQARAQPTASPRAPAREPNERRPAWHPLLRLGMTLLAALLVGRTASHVMEREDRRPEPAGFFRGVLHGAFMPLATPTLLLGKDSPIYAERNTGQRYKAGYAVGVNLCGLVFFGFLFGRARRWRQVTGQRTRA